jgi:hypothetical protein
MVDRALQLEGVREQHKQDEQSVWQRIILVSWNRNHARMCDYSDRSTIVWSSCVEICHSCSPRSPPPVKFSRIPQMRGTKPQKHDSHTHFRCMPRH